MIATTLHDFTSTDARQIGDLHHYNIPAHFTKRDSRVAFCLVPTCEVSPRLQHSNRKLILTMIEMLMLSCTLYSTLYSSDFQMYYLQNLFGKQFRTSYIKNFFIFFIHDGISFWNRLVQNMTQI